MRWYLSRNGETGGPYDEQQVVDWFKSGHIGPESLLQQEGKREWKPILESAIAARIRPSSGNPWLIWGGLAFCLVGFMALALGDRSEKTSSPQSVEAKALQPETPKPKTKTQCIIEIPGDTSGGKIPVMPTERGYDELFQAMASENDKAVGVAVQANSGFLVAPGTECTWLDVGIMTNEVRILEGPHTGKSGFLPREWSAKSVPVEASQP